MYDQPRVPGHKPLEKGIMEGENPVYDSVFAVFDQTFEESGRLGFLLKEGGKLHLKLNTLPETDSTQVP